MKITARAPRMNAALVIATTLTPLAGRHTLSALKPGPIATRLDALNLPSSLAAAGVEGGEVGALRMPVVAPRVAA